MSESRAFLLEVFQVLNQRHGFRRKSFAWCKITEETLTSFDLQRSPYGDCYYMNLGVCFRSLGELSPRPTYKCDVYGRLGDRDAVASLNFEEAVEERGAILLRFRDDTLLPILEQCSTQAGAVAFCASGALTAKLVRVHARGVLGLPDLPCDS